jgi:hypothetical protein
VRTVSAEWEAALAAPYELATRLTVIEGDGTETELTSGLEGAVTLDATSAIRGRVDLTFITEDLDLIPRVPTDLLAPYGNEIRVERGITYADGDTELVSLGVFGIYEVSINDTGSALDVRIIGMDRSKRVADARFEGPYSIASGTSAITALLAVITAAYPQVDTSIEVPTLLTLPSMIAEEGDDRWSFALSIAAAIGMELYFDGDGALALRPIPGGAAVAEIVEGEGGTLLSAQRSWNREGTYNGVIATGENVSAEAAPVRGSAVDLDPDSPTYWYGAFGRVTRFYSSPFLTTDAQAADAAAAILAQEKGTTQQVEFSALPNPALEPGDVVRLTRERVGIDEDGVIESLTIPLDAAGVMSGRTRAIEVYG